MDPLDSGVKVFEVAFKDFEGWEEVTLLEVGEHGFIEAGDVLINFCLGEEEAVEVEVGSEAFDEGIDVEF